MPNGTVITHRVVRLATADGALQIETKGDANTSADPTLHPATGVTGIVRASVPIAGFILGWMTIPSGILSVISMLGSLLVSLWLLEELRRDAQEDEDAAPDVGSFDGVAA